MKRVLGILMVCALLVTGLTAIVSAEEATSIAITTQEGPFVIGDTVTATVKLNNYKETWSAMTIAVNYDPTILVFDDVESGFGEDIGMVAEDKGDKVLICWIAQRLPVPADGILAKVNFTAIAKTTEAIKITSSFVPAGIANQGSTDPVDNSNGDVFDAGVVETPKIEVAPEAPLPPAAPTSATITSTEDPKNKVSFNVNGDYNDNTSEPIHTYKINLSWDEMVYTYSEILDWDNTTHTWFPTEESAKWGEIEPKTITMVNHSSQPVTATVAYEATLAGTAFAFGETAEATEETLSLSFDACTEDTPLDGAPTKKVYAVFNPGETAIKQETLLGTIKITIA